MPPSDSLAQPNRISGQYCVGITNAAVATVRNGKLPSTSSASGLA